MRRNTKFAGKLCVAWDKAGDAYVKAITAEVVDRALCESLCVLMTRLRNVLEFRYNTIV